MEIEDIISKYLSDSATVEEKGFLLQWLEEDAGNDVEFCRLYDLWLHSSASLTDDDEMEDALSRFKERISKSKVKAESTGKECVETESIQKKPAVKFGSYILRIAASVLLLLSAGYVGYMIGDKETTAVAVNRLLTGADGKGEYVLPDGSTVWLNANSVLEYPEIFAGEKRVVSLKGEALFEVKRDTEKPFFVQTGGMDVKVLGTRFLVSNYSEKPVVETMLIDGSVEISGEYFSYSHVLQPGELISYNKETTELDVRVVNANDYTNWINSKLVFDKTNISNVIINLEKWYGVEIEASGELKNMHMTFTVRRESLEEVLKYMSVTSPITYKWKDNVLYLSSKK